MHGIGLAAILRCARRLNEVYIVMELCTGGELFDKLCVAPPIAINPNPLHVQRRIFAWSSRSLQRGPIGFLI
jgi:hypothetical protein